MGDYIERVPDRTGKCVVCGHQTHDRSVTVNRATGKVAHRTWRCEDFEPCKERRAAKKKRPQAKKKKDCPECGGFLWHERGCSKKPQEKAA